MDIEIVVDEGLGNASYLVDLGDGRALAVDPIRDPRPYLERAERRGLTVAFAAETHLHADFVSGSRELAALGATILASADAGLRFPHTAMHDDEELDLGGLTLRAIATPGHTPEHVAFLLSEGSSPRAAFTGGALMHGSVARTDLIAPEQTEPLAHASFRSVGRLLALPDALEVLPTHGAGATFCAAGAPREDETVTTTIGAERAANPFALLADEASYVRTLLAGYGSYPPYFLRLRAVNREGPRIVGPSPPGLRALDLEAVDAAVAAGAEVLDVRPVAAFAGGHVPGSLSIELRPAFATWLGWLVEAGRPLVFVLSPDQDREELVRQCLAIGYEEFAGELDGGVEAWREAGRSPATVELVEPADVPPGSIVDVRQRDEFATTHVEGARSIELGSFEMEVPGLPAGPLVLHCGEGLRAMTAASLLERTGRADVTVVRGDPDDMARDAGLRLVDGSD